MITGRSSQVFHDLVEGSSTAGGASYAVLLEVVGSLRAVPDPVADPTFVAALRERLLIEAESVLAAAAADHASTDDRLRLRPAAPRVRHPKRRLAAAISGVTLAAVTATMAVAAQSAMPGDGLYPLKRGIESARAELTFDQAARGGVLLDDASTRLDEVAELSRENADAATVGDTLDAFTHQAVEGSSLLVADYQATGDNTSITSVRVFTATSMARLAQLQGVVPRAALDQLLQAAQALDQIQQVAVHACAGCAGPSVTSAPTVLTDALAASSDTWQVAQPATTGGGHHHRTQHHGPSGGPQLPNVGGDLPPASVTDPTQAETSTQAPPSADDVQHTVKHLTGGLTDSQQSDVGDTVTDTAGNLLDAVGEAGNLVAGALDGVASLGSALPTDLPSLP